MLDARQVHQFFEWGYVLIPDVFSTTEIATLREAFDRLEQRARALRETTDTDGARFVLDPVGEKDVRIHRVVWCGGVESPLLRSGEDPRLLCRAAQLLGSRDVTQLINQAHFKLPGDEVSFPWHQDSSHRRYGTPEWRDVNGRGSYVQTVIAIDDVTPENGPLRFLPGSARLGHLGLAPDGSLPEVADELGEPIAPTMKAGSLVMFGPYTLHASSPNRSTAARRILINGYAYPGANSRVYPGCGTGRRLRAPRAEPAPLAAFARGRRSVAS